MTGDLSVGFGRRTRTAMAALSFSVIGALAVAATSTEALVERAFSVAIADSATVASVQRNSTPPIAGTEDYWLSQQAAPAAAPGALELTLAAWSPDPIRVGSVVKLTINGKTQNLEVVELGYAGLPVSPVANRLTDTRLVLVTLREKGIADAPLVRFLVEDAAPTQQLPVAHRTS